MATLNFNMDRTFGVEMEFFGCTPRAVIRELAARGLTCTFEGYDHTTLGRWKIVTDSSVTKKGTGVHYGIELVSPPLKGLEGLAEIRTACAALNAAGATVDKSCGLHVHQDASHYTVDNFKNLVRLYGRMEEALDWLVSPSRRLNEAFYSRSVRIMFDQPNFEAKLDACTTAEDVRWAVGDRYKKVNIHAWWRHGTVEFRQHNGTTDADKVVNWVIYTQAMVTRAERKVKVDLRPIAERSAQVNPRYTLTADLGIYATLHQCDDHIRQAVAFFSKRYNHFKKGTEVAA